ncbi:MAG TPA: 6-phosphogluconolactonase [Acidimicrobiales bacterium]|nr:6-phosphogluconolactonase [Acidimicrobiales bacterium]
MQHELRDFADDDSLARAAAEYVADVARRCVDERGRFSFAVSGGRTPWAMFAALSERAMPWARTTIFQVDERVVPSVDPARNVTQLRESLAAVPAVVEPMGVDEEDLDGAAEHYARILPARLDLVHLGLGADGHTASLVPGDPVLDVTDRLVALTGVYDGHRRMTMTYPALAEANQLLWLITGADKRQALSGLLTGDTAIPAGRVEASHSLVMAERSAL